MGITLKEFLKTNDKDIAILMFDKGGRMISQEYSKKEIKNGHISKELMDMIVEDSVEEDDVVEIWVR